MSETNVILEHYTRLADGYDDFLVYSDEFVRTHSRKMIDKLRLTEHSILVDLGGGTGIFCKDILKQVPLRHKVLLVDPFQQMLDKARDHEGIECICQDAVAFSERPMRYDAVLMKEAVHHIADKARLFQNLHRNLDNGGRLLLVHIPPEIDYPLFQKALERSLTWHANPEELQRLLEETGFQVEKDRLVVRHEMPKERYFAMVRAQYMTLLSSFSDDELAAGLKEMEETYRDRETLAWDDRFDYITAVKA